MMSQLTQISSNKLNCCVCHGDKDKERPFGNVDGHNLMKCMNCGLIFMESYTAQPESFLDDVNDKKQGLEYWGYPEIFKRHRTVFDYFFAERLRRINNFHPPESHFWFDIGSGFGLWQEYLKNKGIASKGIEIESNAHRFCEENGLDVTLGNFENWSTDEKFSVITICDVLEHVINPMEVLNKCNEMLIPGGIIYIQVPCVMGFRYPYNDSLGLPHHLWQFTPSTLTTLVTKTHFTPLTYWTGVQGVIKHYENGGPSWWRKSLWKFATISRRGNRLQLLARKQ